MDFIRNLSAPAIKIAGLSSKDEFSIPPEYDGQPRSADIWLYCSSVGSSEISNQGIDFSSPFFNRKTYQHWILCFEFCDGSVRAIEGVNDDGVLKPSFCKSRDDSWNKVKFFESRKISPKRVRQFAVDNRLNGVCYSLLNANCHMWINEVLKELDLDELPSTIDSDIKWKGAALYASVAHPAAGLAVLGAQQVYNIVKGDKTPFL